MKIKISSGTHEFTATLRDSPSSKMLMKILPIQSQANTWGDEVYFEVPMNAALEKDAQQVVDPGTVGFWTQGNCLAIPFGPTPISEGQECRLADRVNLLGKIDGDPKALRVLKSGDPIRVVAL
ncbi:MAG: cyclophilin-like fold protein [bacterium]|nr:cyclophilin-like fold protein [bacterium]